MNLGGIQPCMGVSQSQPVRYQARSGNRQCQFFVIGGLGDRILEQRQQRRGRCQCHVALPDQCMGEGRDLHRFRLIRTQFDLAAYGLGRLSDPFCQHAGAGQHADLGVQTRQLQALYLQTQLDRVPPADIGSTVGVVADPSGQDHRAGRQLRPAVRPGAPGDRDQRGIEPVDRVPAVGDGGDRLIKLTAQGDRRRPVGFEGRGRPAAGGFSQCLIDRQRQREGWMCGEHRRKTRAFRQCAVFRPAHRTVVRIGPQQVLRQTGQDAVVALGVDATKVYRNARRPVHECRVPQIADQRGNIRLGKAAVVQLAGDRQ